MTLNETKWHARLYLWTRVQMYMLATTHPAWRTDGDANRVRELARRTNLCQYIRTLLLWLPLLTGAVLVWAFTVTYCLFFPLFYLDVAHYVGALLLFGFGVAFTAMLIFIETNWHAFTLPFRLVGRTIEYAYVRCSTPKADGTPGLCTLVKKWVIDRHDRICQIIDIG